MPPRGAAALLVARRTVAIVLAAVLLAAGAVAWLRAPRAVRVPAPAGGLAHWNPLLQPDPPLAALLYRALVRLDATGRPLPDLATGWRVQDGGRTWIFPLRAGARFSTGATVSAADAAASLRALADPAFGAAAGRLWWGRGIDVVAGGTAVRVRLPWPDPGFLWEVAAAPVLPAAQARSRDGGSLPGAGPAVLRSVRPDGAVLGDRRGSVRVRWLPPGTPTRPVAARDVFLLAFNTRRAPWSVEATRLAWAAVIDRRALARAAGGRPVVGLFPPGTWAATDLAVPLATRTRLSGPAVLLYPAGRRGAAAAAATLARAWNRAGASVRAEAAGTTRLLAALGPPHDFDLLLTDWPFGPDLEAGPLLQGGAELNAAGWSAPQVDALLAAMDGACAAAAAPVPPIAAPPDLGYTVAAQLPCAGDLGRRAAAAAGLDRLIAVTAPIVPLYIPRLE